MNIKYVELNKFYYKKKRKIKYTTYIARVVRYWWSKENAIKEKLPFTRRTKLKKTAEWRICSKCWELKVWTDFAQDKTNKSNNYRTTNCKECRNKYKQEYRKNNKSKDIEYKKKYRATEYWKQQDKSYIYFKKVYWDSLKRLKELWEIKTPADISKIKKNVLVRDGKDKEFNLLF